MENIPHLVVISLIENKIKSEDPKGFPTPPWSISWNMPTENITLQIITTCKGLGGAREISFLDNNVFVSRNGSSSAHVWNMNEDEPIHTFLKND